MPEELENTAGNARQYFKPVSFTEIQQMRKNYADTLTGPDDTTSAWFSVEVLMALINDNKATGIRIYYGRHSDDHEEYPGRHNVILVATQDPDSADKPNCENSYDQLRLNDDNVAADAAPYFLMGADRGPLCPPRCTT